MTNAAQIVNANASKVAVKQPRNKRGNVLINIIHRFKAKRQARKIINALNEGEQIHKGSKKGKTFDEFHADL